MSSSQFDDLLGDFGDGSTTTTTTTTTTKTTSNGAMDDFDPFGPSDPGQTSNGGDSGLLLDFSADAEVKNGEPSNGLDFQFDTTTSDSSSANPLYDMSADTQSSNPLYDLSSANPLYDLSEADANQSSNPMYDFSSETTTTTTTTTSSEPTNPLYDFETGGTTNDAPQDTDFFSGTNEAEEEVLQQHQEEEVLEANESASNDADLIGGGDFEVENNNVELEQDFEPQVMNGNARDFVPQMEDIEPEEEVQEEVEQPSENVEIFEEAEPVQETPDPSTIPAVEITHSSDRPEDLQEQHEDFEEQSKDIGEQNEDLEEQGIEGGGQEEQLPDLVVREDGDEATGGELAQEFQSEGLPAASAQTSQPELLAADPNYGHDRREVDLENYCMDREESDEVEASMEAQADSLKPREERSRSPSRSMGPDTPEERGTPEDTVSTDTPDENDEGLRPREDRSHAPSRSIEPEDTKNQDRWTAPVTTSTTTYKSSSTIVLSPSSSLPPSAERGRQLSGSSTSSEEEIIEDGRTVTKTTRTEKRSSGSGFETTQRSSQEISLSQWEAEKNRQNADIGKQQGEQDIVQFTEMSSVKNKFESQPQAPPPRQYDVKQEVQASEGGVYESQPQAFQQWQNEEEEEEGVYESTPIKRDDVAREADRDLSADLPAVGTAKSIKERFMMSSQESTQRSKREITPPAHGAGGEYVSEPRGYVEKYEGKAEAGVFESQPQGHNPEVVTSETNLEDYRPQQGYAKNIMSRYKEMATKGDSFTPSSKREITPDRSGRVEFVSEPRGQVERYEGKADSGVFESEPALNPDVVRSGEEVREELPERGYAKNLVNRFKQIGSDTSPPSASTRKRDITPDRSGKIEYSNEPQRNPDVVTSDPVAEEYVPASGFARNVAAKFREMESSAKSPPLSPGRRKEFTPPREEERAKQSVVLENNPEFRQEVIHSGDQLEEALPERGTAKNIAQRFRQMASENTSSSPRAKKEITPPPNNYSGVFENEPKQFQADYNRPAESGILENQPILRDDVVRGTEPPKYEEELPERGAAKNLVSKWRQMESESAKAKSPTSGRPKEFTPPREEPRIAQARKSPRTPKSPSDQVDNGSVHPSDLPGQYQPLNEPNVFESTPEYRQDAVREADTDWTEGMPKKDSAKKMLAKFQNIQAEAKKQQPPPGSRKETEPKRKTPRKESESSEAEKENESDPMMEIAKSKFEDPEKVGRSKSMRAAIQTEKCGACEKTVYAMERLEMNKRVYHKACFRCTQCKAVLTPKTFAINNDVIFCTSHYKQLFATKGNYDEGFGRMQHKKRWSSNPNLADREMKDADAGAENENS